MKDTFPRLLEDVRNFRHISRVVCYKTDRRRSSLAVHGLSTLISDVRDDWDNDDYSDIVTHLLESVCITAADKQHLKRLRKVSMYTSTHWVVMKSSGLVDRLLSDNTVAALCNYVRNCLTALKHNLEFTKCIVASMPFDKHCCFTLLHILLETETSAHIDILRIVVEFVQHQVYAFFCTYFQNFVSFITVASEEAFELAVGALTNNELWALLTHQYLPPRDYVICYYGFTTPMIQLVSRGSSIRRIRFIFKRLPRRLSAALLRSPAKNCGNIVFQAAVHGHTDIVKYLLNFASIKSKIFVLTERCRRRVSYSDSFHVGESEHNNDAYLRYRHHLKEDTLISIAIRSNDAELAPHIERLTSNIRRIGYSLASHTV